MDRTKLRGETRFLYINDTQSVHHCVSRMNIVSGINFMIYVSYIQVWETMQVCASVQLVVRLNSHLFILRCKNFGIGQYCRFTPLY